MLPTRVIHVPTAPWYHYIGVATVNRSCVHFVTPDEQIIPFDTYNTFYRPGAEGAAVVAKARARIGDSCSVASCSGPAS